MRKSHGHDHSEPQTEDMLRKLGYEASDVSLSVLVKWIGFLFVFIGGTAVVTLLIYWIFVPQQKADRGSAATVGKLPPGVPALQAHPKIDMRKFWQEQDRVADGYGWTDQSKGRARVPVDVALDQIAAAGNLPKAEPGAGRIPPARGEDQTGVAPQTAVPGGGASRAPAAETVVPGMPNQATPGAENEGPQSPNNPDFQGDRGSNPDGTRRP